ncbi:threonine dehydrogenase-like Zn-dependent dehydrogenase [Pseudonocardia sediminis]|uniref:Threonine dehydrogenase-like Zn-dependent dehydrogenase n=1 Tax=Pseudonocardia sediminis TaxID=1397368 RepID=A0A4Q7V2F2_PSEST|nr:alcohol dehydrogenase catalytic domain-containing protein [Pseudonocardia sediminis]RZT88742.1 threonine dehydrogenase-like Zn-dependent dehydrogenase [Pseudonocardia sediminis]
MPDTMRALAILRVGEVGLVERDIPRAGPGEAVVRTTASLICTSDVHTVAGALPVPDGRLLGHESVGIVHEVGEGVTTCKVGDRVAVNAVTPDGTCDACQQGYTSQCGGPLGGYRFTIQKDGNLAEYFHVNDADYNLAPIPEGLADEVAVYACDMLSTGFIGAENANIPIGGTAAVFAQGAVGLSATMGAKLCGAGLIIAVEGIPGRAALAKQFGADIVIDPADGNVAEQIMDITHGGVDGAIEALGHPDTWEGCLRSTKAGGTISNLGYHGVEGPTLSIPLDAFGLGMSGKKIVTDLCPGGRERMSRLMRLLDTNKVDPTPMTTHRFAIGDVEAAFETMSSKSDGVVKPLITYP